MFVVMQQISGVDRYNKYGVGDIIGYDGMDEFYLVYWVKDQIVEVVYFYL